MAEARHTDEQATGHTSAALGGVMANRRIARLVEDLDNDTVKAIANSTLPAAHMALDDLLNPHPHHTLYRVERLD